MEKVRQGRERVREGRRVRKSEGREGIGERRERESKGRVKKGEGREGESKGRE